jgi:hypothetical protein
MRVIIDLPENQYQRVQQIVASGAYSNISTFAEVAIDNQVILEQEAEPKLMGISRTDQTEVMHRTGLHTEQQDETHVLRDLKRERIEISHKDIVMAPRNEDVNVFGISDPSDCMLWGQINKIFPIKLLLRYFVNHYLHQSTVGLTEFKRKSRTAAHEIGTYLLNIDRRKKTRKDEKLSIALPLGESPEQRIKANQRFENSYIGHMRKNSNLLSGALVELRFANLQGDYRKQEIGLTKAGFEFSQLENPILDDEEYDGTLSDEEKIFYVEHVRDNVEGEYHAMQSLHDFIEAGLVSRNSLNEAFRSKIESWKNWGHAKELNSFVDTQRSGLTSRMFELGLVEKIRTGITVEYHNSEFSRKVFSN